MVAIVYVVYVHKVNLRIDNETLGQLNWQGKERIKYLLKSTLK